MKLRPKVGRVALLDNVPEFGSILAFSCGRVAPDGEVIRACIELKKHFVKCEFSTMVSNSLSDSNGVRAADICPRPGPGEGSAGTYVVVRAPT